LWSLGKKPSYTTRELGQQRKVKIPTLSHKT